MLCLIYLDNREKLLWEQRTDLIPEGMCVVDVKLLWGQMGTNKVELDFGYLFIAEMHTLDYHLV